MPLSPEQIAEHKRASARARKVLGLGDRITFTSCPGTKRWGEFQGWEVGRDWIHTKTRDDVHAINISKVAGRPVDFSDAGGLPYDEADIVHNSRPRYTIAQAIDDGLPF